MTTEEIKAKMVVFCEREITDLERTYENNKRILDDLTKLKLYEQVREAFLAVAFFCQDLGIDFEEIDEIYQTYKEKLNKVYDEN